MDQRSVSFSVREEPEDYEDYEEDEEVDDNSCCSRATFCNPILRDIIVTNPISKCLGTEITWANAFWMITVTAIILMAWATLFFLLGDMMLPGGSYFGLFILVLSSYFLGWSLAYLPYANLPPVFGMLLAGIIIRNTNFYDIGRAFDRGTIGKIRTFCITFIMIRAGLQLTTTPIRRYPLFVTILALVPCTIEMLVVAICSIYILGYPWQWALMTGTIVACMSPVVTVNCMLALAERGYGEDKGLATLINAASSIDDIHILSLFSIFYSIVFHDDRLTAWWSYIPAGIRDLLLGISVGLVLGTFLTFFPHRNHRYVTWYRLSSLLLASLMCTSSTSKLNISGGPYLAIIIMSFVANTGWKILTISYNVEPFRRAAYFLWHFMQPVLVGVIGADIDFKDWSLPRFGLYCACISIGITARYIVAILSTITAPFSWKERMFIALAWIPKGTLQAALAPMAYERANIEDPDHIELAADIVRISVVTIVFLAPLGAILISISGPLLLNKATIEERERERRLSHLRIRSLQPVRTRKIIKTTTR